MSLNDTIVSLRQEGRSLTNIAALLGVSKGTVSGVVYRSRQPSIAPKAKTLTQIRLVMIEAFCNSFKGEYGEYPTGTMIARKFALTVQQAHEHVNRLGIRLRRRPA